MRFEDALKAMRDGKKVRRAFSNIWLEIEDGVLWERWRNPDHPSEIHGCSVSLGNREIMAEDWEICAEDSPNITKEIV